MREKVPDSGSAYVLRILDQPAMVYPGYRIVDRSRGCRRTVVGNNDLPRHLQATALTVELFHLLYARVAVDGYKNRQTLHGLKAFSCKGTDFTRCFVHNILLLSNLFFNKKE